MTQANETKFLCSVNNELWIMCEKHARAFEFLLTESNEPHTIIELEPDDAKVSNCMACELQNDLARPQIILPN